MCGNPARTDPRGGAVRKGSPYRDRLGELAPSENPCDHCTSPADGVRREFPAGFERGERALSTLLDNDKDGHWRPP